MNIVITGLMVLEAAAAFLAGVVLGRRQERHRQVTARWNLYGGVGGDTFMTMTMGTSDGTFRWDDEMKCWVRQGGWKPPTAERPI